MSECFLHLVFPFDPNNLALADVRSENARLSVRLRTCISLETMKQALEDKDNQLAGAWKNANDKTKEAEDTLKGVELLKQSNKTWKTAGEKMQREIDELKKSYADWDEKFKIQSATFEKEKKQLDEKVLTLTSKKEDLDKYVEKVAAEMAQNLEGKALETEWFDLLPSGFECC